MRIEISIIAVGLLLPATAAQAQTWEELLSAPTNIEVRVDELGGSGGSAEGILQSVEGIQLTILKGRNPVTIPRDRIARVRERKKDTIWDGALGGLLYGLVMDLIWRDSSWTSKQTAGHYLGSAGLGMFIDWNIRRGPTLYKATP